MKPITMIPFNGVYVPVMIRELNQVQIESCGEFSLIETVNDLVSKKMSKPNPAKMLAYSKLQYEILKKALVSPSYDQIMEMNEFDELRKHAEEEIENLKALIFDLKESPKKRRFKNDLDVMIMNTRFYLPGDFVAFVVSRALSVDKSDIKLISEDMLYNAAVKAKLGGDNPANHLDGNFTPFNKDDINSRGWAIYYQRQKNDKGK